MITGDVLAPRVLARLAKRNRGVADLLHQLAAEPSGAGDFARRALALVEGETSSPVPDATAGGAS